MSTDTGPTLLPESVDQFMDMECSECGSSCKARCLAFHMNRFGCHKEMCPLHNQPVNGIIDQAKFVARPADPAKKSQPRSQPKPKPVPPFAPEPPKFWESQYTDTGADTYRDSGRDQYREQTRRREPSRGPPPSRGADDGYRGRDRDSSDRDRRRGPSRARDADRDREREREQPRRRHTSRPPSPERQDPYATRGRDSDRHRDAPKKTKTSYPPRAGGTHNQDPRRSDRSRSQTRGSGMPPTTNTRPSTQRARSRGPDMRGTGTGARYEYEDDFSPRAGGARYEEDFSPRAGAGAGTSRMPGPRPGPATYSSPSPFMQHGFAARGAGVGGGSRDPFDYPLFQGEPFSDPFFQHGPGAGAGARPGPWMGTMPPMPAFGSRYGTDVDDMIDRHMAEMDAMVEQVRSRFGI